jgi:hypothetical protein
MSNRSSQGALRFAVAAVAAFAVFGAAAEGSRAPANAGTSADADAQARYQQERAACMNGRSSQDQATCLKEAGAALAEGRRGNLTSGKGQLPDNRMDRCNALTGDEKSDCIARMRGEGTTEGSVEGGGILREKVTIVPGSASQTTAPSTGAATPAK